MEESSAAEEHEVKRWLEKYEQAREFDKEARKQYEIDRRWAAGTADPNWASDSNLIGMFIEILTAYLYARDPDVSSRPSDATGTARRRDAQDFAKTLEIVVSRLWRDGKLKKATRKAVRSALTVGPGWLKVIMLLGQPETDAEVNAAVNDLQDNQSRYAALQRKLLEEGAYSEDATSEIEREMADLAQGMSANVEVVVRKSLAIDFCRPDDIQVSMDVSEMEDYLEASWIANSLFVPTDELCERFPALDETDKKNATKFYHQKPEAPSEQTPITGQEPPTEKYTKNQQSGADGKTPTYTFAKIIEIWDRRTNMVRTVVEGVKKYARQPFTPEYASSRFYPFFYLGFFEVDDSRHPQSMTWRLHKLQAEYNHTRSNFRLLRERSIPGTLVNAGQIDKNGMTALRRSTHQEFIPIKATSQDVPLANLFAPKPVAQVDPMLYDTGPILRDMEKISGVQEAQQSSIAVTKTATEAEIQHSGFQSRTSSARDLLEEMLSELASYTAEIALQTLNYEEVTRYAGPGAFWPEGLPIETITQFVEVDIEGGSTGKPETTREREAWGILLPELEKSIMAVFEARSQGQEPLAQAVIELMRETLNRMGDRIDVERFVEALFPMLPGQAPMGMGGGGGEIPPEMAGEVIDPVDEVVDPIAGE